MKYTTLISIMLVASLNLVANAQLDADLENAILNSKGLKPGDEGWLKARHAACKLKYDFDKEVFENCYENGKAEHIYVLTASLIEGTPELQVIEKRCMKHEPLWTEVLGCTKRIMKVLNEEQ